MLLEKRIRPIERCRKPRTSKVGCSTVAGVAFDARLRRQAGKASSNMTPHLSARESSQLLDAIVTKRSSYQSIATRAALPCSRIIIDQHVGIHDMKCQDRTCPATPHPSMSCARSGDFDLDVMVDQACGQFEATGEIKYALTS